MSTPIPPTPPPSLPTFIFLVSDHLTRQLACDVAEELSSLSPAVLIDDFLGPIHDGLSAMLELDMKRDLGSPSSTNRLVIECVNESTEQDLINSLERWFINQFGDNRLGQLGYLRALENRAISDYTIVFRDATDAHMRAFAVIAQRDKCVMRLTVNDTKESIVRRILKGEEA